MINVLLMVLIGFSFLIFFNYTVFTIVFRKGSRPDERVLPEYPLVSILKPVKSLDDDIETNFVSFFELDYPAFELLFAADSLTDPVGTSPQNHDLPPVGDFHLVRGIVSGEVISGVLHSAHGHRLPGFLHSQADTPASDLFLRHLQKHGQVPVGKSVLFGLDEKIIR